MTRHSKPPPPPRERTVKDELQSVEIAPTLKRHWKRRSTPTATTTRPEAMSPVEQTARDLLAAREQAEQVSARQNVARQDAEARWARQIRAIAAEAAALLLGPVPE